MTILVTGSSGFIGSNLIRFLQKKNIKFFGVDKVFNPYFKIKNFAKFNLNNKSEILRLFRKQKIKKVIHLAALPGFVNCHKKPKKAYEDNVSATLNLLTACKSFGIKDIIVASSMGVNNFYKNPSIYALTKIACENICRSFNKIYKMNIKICKISNVFGPYSLHKLSSVHAFIKQIINNKKIQIHKKGMQERDFIFVEDVCKKLYLSLNSRKPVEEFKINNNRYLRIIDLLHILNKISKKTISYEFVKTPSGYDDTVYNKKILKEKKDLTKKFAITYNWYKNTYNIK